MNGKTATWRVIVEGLAGVAAAGAAILLDPFIPSWYRRWGATEAEVQRSFPGDEQVPHPKSQLTCAITIRAPASYVWPWFVQLGCQRAGWYSYDLLDNGGNPSAERILPEYQHLAVGDLIKAVPNGSFGFPVAAYEPNRFLTLGGTINTRTGKPADPGNPAPERYFSGDQTFFLADLNGKTTRLIFRMRTDWNPSQLNDLAYHRILEPVSFVMGRKMLLNLKRRAEATQGVIQAQEARRVHWRTSCTLAYLARAP